jgi:hypothetical protein
MGLFLSLAVAAEEGGVERMERRLSRGALLPGGGSEENRSTGRIVWWGPGRRRPEVGTARVSSSTLSLSLSVSVSVYVSVSVSVSLSVDASTRRSDRTFFFSILRTGLSVEKVGEDGGLLWSRVAARWRIFGFSGW